MQFSIKQIGIKSGIPEVEQQPNPPCRDGFWLAQRNFISSSSEQATDAWFPCVPTVLYAQMASNYSQGVGVDEKKERILKEVIA